MSGPEKVGDMLRQAANAEFERLKARCHGLHLLADLVDYLERSRIEHALERGDGVIRLSLYEGAAPEAARAPETDAPQVSSLPGAAQSPGAGADPEGAAPGGDEPIPLKSGPYSQAEVEAIGRALRQGKTKEQIARVLNRDARGVHVGIKRARLQMERAAKAEGPKPTTPGPRQAVAERPAPAPSSRVASPAVRPALSPQATEPNGAATPSGLSPKRSDETPPPPGFRSLIAEHLRRLPANDNWTTIDDFNLAAMRTRGQSMADVALALDIPQEECAARWERLQMPIKILRQQARKRGADFLEAKAADALLAELRERAG